MKSVRVFVLLTVLTFLSASVGMAQEEAPEQLGKVVFPTSCDAKVQPRFERAVALLHSFSWQEGEKAFREVLEDDPNCAIATWGIASILIGNTFGVGPKPEERKEPRKLLHVGAPSAPRPNASASISKRLPNTTTASATDLTARA